MTFAQRLLPNVLVHVFVYPLVPAGLAEGKLGAINNKMYVCVDGIERKNQEICLVCRRVCLFSVFAQGCGVDSREKGKLLQEQYHFPVPLYQNRMRS